MARYRSYGIELESEFSVPALVPSAPEAGAASLSLKLGSPEDIDRALPAGIGRCVELIEHPDGRVGLRIECEPTVGYRMEVGRYGQYFLSADGSTAVCAPAEVEAWRRERFLVARVIPIAALLGGREILHASGVVLDGAGVAFLGGSGAGKTSIALRLALDGAPALSDDLLSIESVDGMVVAHPGTRQIGIRRAEHELLDEEELRLLGEPVDRGDKHYGTVRLAEGCAPIRLCYLLRRRRDAVGTAISLVSPPDPRPLLGATFFDQLQLTEARLAQQLELCSGIARQASVYRVDAAPDVSAAELAVEIREHAAAELAAPAAT